MTEGYEGFALAIGIAIGYFVARWEYRKWIARLESEACKERRLKEVERELKELMSKMYVSHLDSHTCKFVGENVEWPEYLSVGDDQC